MVIVVYSRTAVFKTMMRSSFHFVDGKQNTARLTQIVSKTHKRSTAVYLSRHYHLLQLSKTHYRPKHKYGPFYSLQRRILLVTASKDPPLVTS